MPSIMQSIHSFHCKNIAIGRKGFEVRKTKPNIPTPFKVYIYCTKDGHTLYYDIDHTRVNLYHAKAHSQFAASRLLNGKVIGEYICDEIQEWVFDNEYTRSYDISDDDLALTCLTREQLWEYGKGKTLYGYHISNLKIYDEPKELSEFKQCHKCPYGDISNCAKHDYCCDGTYKLTRPPQSWCYCEEVAV